ncbi:MAG: hypothetical protein AAGI11_18830 [Pseudomonadota bacterium]
MRVLQTGYDSPATGECSAMLNNTGKSKLASKRRSENHEVRLLVVILFPCFFLVETCKRLLHVGERRQNSCFEEAKRSTYSVIPYTMMQ